MRSWDWPCFAKATQGGPDKSGPTGWGEIGMMSPDSGLAVVLLASGGVDAIFGPIFLAIIVVPVIVLFAYMGKQIGEKRERGRLGAWLGIFGPVGWFLVWTCPPWTRRCPHCGGKIPEDAKVCEHCGKKAGKAKRDDRNCQERG